MTVVLTSQSLCSMTDITYIPKTFGICFIFIAFLEQLTRVDFIWQGYDIFKNQFRCLAQGVVVGTTKSREGGGREERRREGSTDWDRGEHTWVTTVKPERREEAQLWLRWGGGFRETKPNPTRNFSTCDQTLTGQTIDYLFTFLFPFCSTTLNPIKKQSLLPISSLSIIKGL